MSLLPAMLQSGLFVRATQDDVLNCLMSWDAKIEKELTAKPFSGGIAAAADFLEPRQITPNRAVLLSILPKWTVFLDNDKNQWLPHSTAYIVSQRLQTDAYSFFLDEGRNGDRDRSAQFYAALPQRDEMIVRQVTLYDESKFEACGPVLPFEDLARYARRRPRERMTEQLRREYGQSLGLCFWDERLYGDLGVQLSWNEGVRNKADADRLLAELLKSVPGKLVRRFP